MANKGLNSILKELSIALLGGGLLFGLFTGARYLVGQRQSARNVKTIQMGYILSDFDSSAFKQTKRTLLIATSASCKYSIGNLDFHRRLVAGAAAAGLGILVVVPDQHSSDFAQRELSLPPQDIVVADLRAIGITGTPVVAVLDPGHRVEHLWIGHLPAYIEEMVLAQAVSSHHILSAPDMSQVFQMTKKGRTDVDTQKLKGNEDKPTEKAFELTDSDLESRMKQATLVDISTRDDFSRMGRPHSINIPSDELSVRAKYELKSSNATIIDCSYVAPGDCDASSYALEKAGFSSVEVLDRGAMGATCFTTPTK